MLLTQLRWLCHQGIVRTLLLIPASFLFIRPRTVPVTHSPILDHPRRLHARRFITCHDCNQCSFRRLMPPYRHIYLSDHRSACQWFRSVCLYPIIEWPEANRYDVMYGWHDFFLPCLILRSYRLWTLGSFMFFIFDGMNKIINTVPTCAYLSRKSKSIHRDTWKTGYRMYKYKFLQSEAKDHGFHNQDCNH
jgi:hypothetical protein